jgi:peptidoglycan/LPS O-acetylase OafA/YrhL
MALNATSVSMYRNFEIDRLRAIAILITLYAHLDFIMLGESSWYTASKALINPMAGVVLFFVISGYVISQTLIPSLDSSKRKRDALLAFWIKRITRIAPMALMWILIPLLLSFAFNDRSMFGSFRDNVPGAVAAALNCYNFFTVLSDNGSVFGAYWTLSLEEQFYAIFPVFLMLLPDPQARLRALMVGVLVPAMVDAWPLQLRMNALIFGVLLYMLTVCEPHVRDTQVSKWMGMGTTLLLSAGLTICQPLCLDQCPIWVEPMASAFLATLLVWLAIQRRSFILPLGKRSNAVVEWIGTRSFGLYLVHIPAYMLAGEITWRLQAFDTASGRACIAAAALLAATEFCYRFFETPLRRWGREVASRVGGYNGSLAYEP